MGARGPAAKPTKLRELQGNPGKRPLNRKEPRPGAGKMPSAPRWMSLEAKRQWRRLAPKLYAAGLLTEVDGLGLAMLCEAVGQYVEGKEIVEKEGAIAVSDQGNVYQHPAIGLMKTARAEVLRWAREFGMTPAARSRISVDGDGSEEQSLADLLFEAVG